MRAEQIMTPDPIAATPEMTIAEAARLMLDHRISGLPVTEGKARLVGMLTEGDLLRRAETGTERHRSRWLELLMGPGRLAGDYVDAHARKVSEIMTTDIVSVAPGAPLDEIVALMEKHHVKRVPVVDTGRLVGIVSRADLVRALLDQLVHQEEASAGGASDAEIGEAVRKIIDKEPWGPRFSVEVTVKDGVVQLDGTVTDDRERTALTVAAETVAGVKQVRNRLVWVEPTSGLVIPAEGERA